MLIKRFKGELTLVPLNSTSRSKWPVIVSTKQGSSNAAFVPVDYSSNSNYIKSGQSGYIEIGTLDNSNNATIDQSGGLKYAALVQPGHSKFSCSNDAAIINPDSSGNAAFATSSDSGNRSNILMFQAIRYDPES